MAPDIYSTNKGIHIYMAWHSPVLYLFPSNEDIANENLKIQGLFTVLGPQMHNRKKIKLFYYQGLSIRAFGMPVFVQLYHRKRTVFFFQKKLIGVQILAIS